MDCFDIYLHVLVMNTKIKKYYNFHREKKNLLKKILKILKNIELKKNWIREFNMHIPKKDTWGYEYFHWVGGGNKYIHFIHILHNVNKQLNIDNNDKEFIYELYNPNKFSSLLNEDNDNEILFDKLEKIYYMLIKLYKKEIGKIYKLYHENITYILEEEKSIKETAKLNAIYNENYCFASYGISTNKSSSYKNDELNFVQEDKLHNYYRNKIIGVLKN